MGFWIVVALIEAAESERHSGLERPSAKCFIEPNLFYFGNAI
jgi:hypothetical protein